MFLWFCARDRYSCGCLTQLTEDHSFLPPFRIIAREIYCGSYFCSTPSAFWTQSLFVFTWGINEQLLPEVLKALKNKEDTEVTFTLLRQKIAVFQDNILQLHGARWQSCSVGGLLRIHVRRVVGGLADGVRCSSTSCKSKAQEKQACEAQNSPSNMTTSAEMHKQWEEPDSTRRSENKPLGRRRRSTLGFLQQYDCVNNFTAKLWWILRGSPPPPGTLKAEECGPNHKSSTQTTPSLSGTLSQAAPRQHFMRSARQHEVVQITQRLLTLPGRTNVAVSCSSSSWVGLAPVWHGRYSPSCTWPN